MTVNKNQLNFRSHLNKGFTDKKAGQGSKGKSNSAKIRVREVCGRTGCFTNHDQIVLVTFTVDMKVEETTDGLLRSLARL